MNYLERIPERLSEQSKLRHEEHERKKSIRQDRKQGHKPGSKPRRLFLKGPIPADWLKVAGKRRSGLAVGLGVWHFAGLEKRKDNLMVCPEQLLARFGVSKKVTYNGLRVLERAGLVKVERHHGCCPRVTIILVEEDE